MYHAGAAPKGVLDMAGTVWEWCDSPYDPLDKTWQDARVLRGGSWDFGQEFARSASRRRNSPDFRGISIGFRMVCSSPILRKSG